MNSLPKTPRLAPLPIDRDSALQPVLESARNAMGFVPNSLLIMQRKPEMVRAFAQLHAAVWQIDCEIDGGFKRLLGHVASRAAGCQYCVAHTAGGAVTAGLDPARVEAVWRYRDSPLFSAAERSALDVAVGAGSVPNGVTDEEFERLREHWSETQICEILGVISIFGFLNRWNDTLATPLEDAPMELGERVLASQGWRPGKHRPASSSDAPSVT